MSCQRSILTLQSCLAVPVYIPEEEVNVGRALFHNFVHDQFLNQGLSDDAVIDSSNTDIVNEHVAMVSNVIVNERSASAIAVQKILYGGLGGQIRGLANEFRQSTQREQIRQHAFEVDLSNITFEGFWALLEEVFRHGINVYNIIALFFFCSDVLIRSVKLELTRIGMNLFKWALQYISERVCDWVYQQGGWEKTIKQIVKQTPKFVKYTAVIVVVGALGWGLYKGLKS